MPVTRITMTQFMHFTFAPVTRRRTIVREIKRNDGFPSYYNPVRQAIVHALYSEEAEGYKHDLTHLQSCHTLGRDNAHQRNLRAVSSSFTQYLSENKVRYLEDAIGPGKRNYDIGDLRVGIWGDLPARINNRKYFLKLYLNDPEPQEGFDQAATGLFILAFPDLVEKGIMPRILRVRKPSRIFRAPRNLDEIKAVLEHEADSFLRYWDTV